jgi:hypothetical protein
MKNNKIIPLALAALVASVCASQAQTLLVRMPFTDTGAGTTCASDTSTGGSNVTLTTLAANGTAANFHGVPGSGVSGLNVALDFSTNSDFPNGGPNPDGGNGTTDLGPIAETTGSTGLNFGVMNAYTATIWFKPASAILGVNNQFPRYFILGAHGTTDKAAANSLGMVNPNGAPNSMIGNFDTTSVTETTPEAGAYAVGQWYFVALTYDGTTASIYQGNDNGTGVSLMVAQAAAGLSIALTNASGSVLAFANRINQQRGFNGWIDDFRFYTNAASENFVEDIRWSALAPIVSAAPGNNQVILTFTNLAGATSFSVSNSASIGGPYTLLATVTSPTYTDITAVNGTTSYYIVTAVDAGGDGTTSQNSQPVAATPEPPPTTPQFATATASNATVYLSWTASTGVPAPITYNLAKSTTTGTEVFLLNTSATSYKDTNVANGIEYFYTVTAVNAAGELSATSVETNSTPIGPPAAPAQVFADAVSGGVLVSWTAVPGATSFNILRSTTGAGGTYTTIATLVTGSSYLDASGALGDYYEVVAVGPGGSSVNSSPADAVPMLLNVNFDSAANGNNYGGGEVPPPSAMSGAAVIGSPGDTWNGVNDGGADPATYTAGPLVNADGSSSSATLSLSAPGGEFDDNAPAFNSFTPFSWASVADMNADIGYPNSPYAALMATLLSSGGADGYVQLGGLTPNAAYTLYVYSAGNAAGRASTFSITQGTAASPGPQQGITQTCTYDDRTITLVNGVDYLVFTNVVADTNGDLTINWGNGVAENDFCGFQLVQGVVLGATISAPPNLNGQTLCTNTSATFTASSGSINGFPTTTILRFTNVVTTSALGSSVSTSTTNVYTANGTFSGTVVAGISNSTATLTMPLTSNLKYSVKVTAAPATGAPLVAATTFDTFAPSLVIEASDYNFSGGSWFETPANGGVWLYSNVVAQANIDFYKSGGEGPNALFYRDLFAGAPYITEANADTVSEQKFAVATTGATIGSNDFPALSIGYDTVGDWQNYTRTFGTSGYPTDSATNGTYNVWLFMSISGGGEDATLSSVTPSPPTTTSQTATPIGQFGTASFAENDWNGFEYVPMTDAYGNLLAITIGSGVQTYQLQDGPSGGPNLGFLMLMPATPILTPGLSYLYPDGTHPFEPTNFLAFTVTPNNGSNILTSGIDLVLNGVDVSAGLKFTAGVGGTWKVTYPIRYNAVYAAVISITNTAGVSSAFPINFDTFNVNFYQWEAVDYDFSTNDGNFGPPGVPPAQGGETLGGWYSGQFIDNPVPTADTTSTTTTGQLGTEATNSYFSYPANVTPASDFGAGAIAQQGVDINVTANGQGAGQALYRSQDGVGNQVATDYLRPKFLAARTKFSDPNIGPYNVGYIAPGNWFNYTRHYPAGYYNVWSRLAFDVNYGLSFGEVTAGVGTATQTVTPLGTFTGNNGAGYQSWQWIPLLDANSNQVAISLSGQATTFQATAQTGINMEFFMLVPAAFPLTPSYVAGQFQVSFPTDSGYTYQIQYKSSLTAPSWTSVGLPITGDGTVHTVPESSPGFYQVVATP